MSVRGKARVVVVAVGNDCRRDDGVGSAVLERLRHLASVATLAAVREPLELLDLWAEADMAVVIDALGSTDLPGTVLVAALQLAADPHSTAPLRPSVSGHGFGTLEVLRLAQQLGTAPSRVVVVGVVGADFGYGVGLSPTVASAVTDAARQVELLVRSVRPEPATASPSPGP